MDISILAVAVSLAVIAWVGIDAARRRRNWLGWSGAASFLGVFGLIAWLLRRRRIPFPPEPVGPGRAALIVATSPVLLGLTLIVVTWWTAFVCQVARVEGGAMVPTLEDRDRVIVDKTAYRMADPRAGEIVMLHYPLDPDRTFVLRVIAEEGDQVRIAGGRVFRNDVPLDEPYLAEAFRGRHDWGPEIVPEGYYFVLADHRENGLDSRHWKYVPRKYIVGRVALRWWPLSRAGAI